jgi:hypothetical protein
VVFFDEADCLVGNALISFLRQLRDGYVNRKEIPFPKSIALVGMLDVRDYKAQIRSDGESLGQISPFNIISEDMLLRNFTAEEVAARRPGYVSREIYQSDPEIREAIDMIRQNVFSLLDPGLFDPIVRNLLDYNDYYMLLADLRAYCEAQDRVDAAYRDAKKWNRMSLVNVARSGFFSSDRSVMEYARDIWHISPVKF